MQLTANTQTMWSQVLKKMTKEPFVSGLSYPAEIHTIHKTTQHDKEKYSHSS